MRFRHNPTSLRSDTTRLAELHSGATETLQKPCESFSTSFQHLHKNVKTDKNMLQHSQNAFNHYEQLLHNFIKTYTDLFKANENLFQTLWHNEWQPSTKSATPPSTTWYEPVKTMQNMQSYNKSYQIHIFMSDTNILKTFETRIEHFQGNQSEPENNQFQKTTS